MRCGLVAAASTAPATGKVAVDYELELALTDDEL
jgi:hypothetical protein